MIRLQVRLTEKQSELLKLLASREGISIAEVVRRVLDQITQSTVFVDRAEMKRRAIAAIGSCHSDRTDLSSRHDDYLAEAYSR